MKKIFYIITVIAATLSVSSCKDFFDINVDPNSPAEENVSAGMILPGAEMAIAQCVGDFFRITGGYYSQQYSHGFGTSNYLDFSQFSMSGTRSSGNYTTLYQGALVNLKTVKEKAAASEDWATYLAATAYMAYCYQLIADAYSDAPYTEALDYNNLTPKFEDAQTIYNGILADLNEALEKAIPNQKVVTNFLYPDGNSSDWIAFANSLKLKILMRMSDVANVQTLLAALIEEDNFITSDAQFAGCWSNAEGNANPFYSEEYAAWHVTGTNVVVNVALTRTMQVYDSEGTIQYTDPRIDAFFSRNSSGNFVGGISGTNFAATAAAPYNSAASFSRPVVEYNTPVVLISVAEVEFFKAEYYAKYGSESDAAAHYEAAIKASFASAGVEGAEENIERYPFDNANYAESIGIAKWIALSGVNTFESWCELRRLKYPAFSNVKGSDMWDGSVKVTPEKYEWGTLYTPYQVYGQVGEKKLLQRWPYANATQSRNTNCPDFKGYTTPIFWAE